VLAKSVDDFVNSGHIRRLSSADNLTRSADRRFPLASASSFEMTNLGLRITLPCSTKFFEEEGRRALFACLDCELQGSDGPVGIFLQEVVSIGAAKAPLGTFRRVIKGRSQFKMTLSLEDEGLYTRSRQNTLLYIVQREFRSAPLFSPGWERCSLDYGGLSEAGFLLEAFTTNVETVARDKSCIIINLHDSLWPDKQAPQLIFFRRSGQNATRLCITLANFGGRIWSMVDSSIDGIQTPEFVLKLNPLETNRWDLGEFVDHAITSEIHDAGRVKLTLRRAIQDNWLGYMIKLTTSAMEQYSYNPENQVPLRKLLSDAEFPANVSFGNIIKVL